MSVPYMNPYYFQSNPAYQQNMQNPYEQVNQLRNQLNQQPQYQYGQVYQQQQQMQTFGLNGEIVDSIDVVNAKNVDMSGNVTYYPKSDGTEIYTKQLQADGRSRTLVYRIVDGNAEENEVHPVTMDTLNNLLNQMKTDMISEIKAILPDYSVTKMNRQPKGGASE